MPFSFTVPRVEHCLTWCRTAAPSQSGRGWWLDWGERIVITCRYLHRLSNHVVLQVLSGVRCVCSFSRLVCCFFFADCVCWGSVVYAISWGWHFHATSFSSCVCSPGTNWYLSVALNGARACFLCPDIGGCTKPCMCLLFVFWYWRLRSTTQLVTNDNKKHSILTTMNF